MRATIRRWGNSGAVRIPAAILESTSLACDQPVEIAVEAGRIVIKPLRRKNYRLADLLRQIRDDNLQAEIDVGPPAGREIL